MGKDFTNNPTLAYLLDDNEPFTDDNATPGQATPQPKLKETLQTSKYLYANLRLLDEQKNKHVHLCIQPTIWALAKQEATRQGISTNNYIVNAIIEALEKLAEG